MNFKIGKFNTTLQTKVIWGLKGITYALSGMLTLRFCLNFMSQLTKQVTVLLISMET